MELYCGDLTFIFQMMRLNFIKFNIQNTFKRYREKTLREAVESREYNQLVNKAEKSYSAYLDMPLGEFLFKLKKREDDFYLDFLHSNGDTSFCKFKLKDTNYNHKKGLYLYHTNEIKYIGKATETFQKRINSNYGNISPKNCYKSGRPTNCRINHLINENQSIQLYLCVLTEKSNDEISQLETKLIQRYNPPWNLIKYRTSKVKNDSHNESSLS